MFRSNPDYAPILANYLDKNALLLFIMPGTSPINLVSQEFKMVCMKHSEPNIVTTSLRNMFFYPGAQPEDQRIVNPCHICKKPKRMRAYNSTIKRVLQEAFAGEVTMFDELTPITNTHSLFNVMCCNKKHGPYVYRASMSTMRIRPKKKGDLLQRRCILCVLL